jgi:ribosomal protein L19E
LTASQPEYEPLSGVVKRPHEEEVAKTADPVVIKKRKRTGAGDRRGSANERSRKNERWKNDKDLKIKVGLKTLKHLQRNPTAVQKAL